MPSPFSLQNDAFVIDGYNQTRPFSSFLPGIAGEYGKPMWVFYTNRGQGISSFGVRNKNGAMLEFYPANKAYALTPLWGFRTFFRFRRGREVEVYEPFRVQAGPEAKQVMRIRPYELEIEETHPKLGLRVTASVFGLPNETLPVLVRLLRVENIGRRPLALDMADGLPQVVPYGLNETLLKQMSRTMEAFAEVRHVDDALPFFKLKTEPSDKSEVVWIHGGFFSFALAGRRSLPILVDPERLFGADTSFQHPAALLRGRPVTARAQRTESRFSCAFSLNRITLAPRAAQTVCSYYGQAGSWEEAAAFRTRIQAVPAYADQKRRENAALVAGITDAFDVHSRLPRLNAYSRQTYLDNILRGGIPWVASDGERSQTFHWGTRKHGDMERDYNFFELAPTTFSQGNGNYRDVNQNRRCESLLYAGLDGGNIETFFNLLQLDGFNPLIIHYEKFLVGGRLHQPGEIFESLRKASARPEEVKREFERTLAHARKAQDAAHGEGFWIDHWTYNLDLLETYAAVYPDRMPGLLTAPDAYTYYDNDHVVLPRDKKYVLRADGAVRQVHAVQRDRQKADLIRRRKEDPHKVRTQGGTGAVYKTSLLAKILGLLSVKAASLDPFGVGLEMEADKPGWCDALNGLPGLLGSSVNEAYELKRWAQFLLEQLPRALKAGETHRVAEESADLLGAVRDALALARPGDFFKTWDTLASLKERFRERTRLGVTGKETSVSREEIEAFLRQLEASVTAGLARAARPDGLVATYFINEMTEFERLPPRQATEDPDAPAVQHVRPLAFKQTPLGPFLEGPVHGLRAARGAEEARALYRAVKRSALYDRKLKMYKLNVPLDKESYEIGRNKIFTPGWLENESIFLHMHYKFLLETLRSGLAEEFFEDIQTGVVAFMNPAVYGRSVLENSSFIASSRFPDARAHGTGFVARLSGSTVEWISMLLHMGLGARPFRWADGELRFEPAPTLAAWLFTDRADGAFEKNTFGFKLFGQTWLVYRNPFRRDTFGARRVSPVRYHLLDREGRTAVVEGRGLPDAPARALRQGRYARVTVDLA